MIAEDSVSPDLLKKCLRQFEHYIVSDIYYTLLGCIPYSNEGDAMEGSIAQLVCSGALIATAVTCLTERERRGGY